MIHRLHHLPRYSCKSVSGGRSEATFLSHLARYCRESTAGNTLNAPPAAVFAENRVRWAVRCIISLSPLLKKVASVPRAAPFPVIPLSSSPLRRPRPRPERAASAFRRKKSQKKVQKNLEVREKAVPLQSRSERGAPERPRGERKRGVGAVPDGHGKFIDKTGISSTSKVPKSPRIELRETRNIQRRV